ncbi:MAG: hypothetical protein OEO82_11210 [Gammaproteobacteria bacterium]|nr:hypothetical protein [Gammaproteobacteria bacterium]
MHHQDAGVTARQRIGSTAALVVFLLGAGIASGQENTTVLPEGDGRELVAQQCTNCHPLGTALMQQASRDAWQAVLERMVKIYMAPINDRDTEIILDYLSANFSAGTAVDPGQQLLAEACFSCHGEGMWQDLKTDREGWLSALYRMVGRGGKWTENEINVMADYLAATYPQGAGQ